MVKGLKICAIILGAALAFGCGQKSSGSGAVASLHISPEKPALHENNPVTGNHLVKRAKSQIGTPYVFGGSKPGGFDCSGLVQWAYNSVGVTLPRTAREQSVVGEKVKDVKDMRAGDIVAFRHPKRGYHTGIYVGDGKFVHSPRKRSHVRINSLSDPYFKSTLLGARRVSLDGSENLIAQSESRLRELVAEKSKLSLASRNLEKIKNVHKRDAKKHSKSVASTKAGRSHKTVAAKKAGPTKSTIASQARKIKSVKMVTGKKGNLKNGDAHARLASASKKATGKAVSMLHAKEHKPAAKKRAHS